MDKTLKQKIIDLRTQGKTYSEIRKSLGRISKGTLSYICKNIVLNNRQKDAIAKKIKFNLIFARNRAIDAAKLRRENREQRLLQENQYLGRIIQQPEVAKIALAMLFLGEGSKTHTATVMFGNSNPEIIKLFLHLFRKCYSIDEEKLHCTVQCRADQDLEKLVTFWSGITGVSKNRFYKTQVDKRTIGKPSKKSNYRGVCRLDYISTEVVCDLAQSIKVLTNTGL